MRFDRREIESTALWRWDDDDYYVLSYPPTRRRNAVTDFILAFKNNNDEAVALATEIILSALRKIDAVLKKRECKHIVSVPPATAGKTNVPCERVCQAVAREFEWIAHLPKALRRTESVRKSAFSPPWNRPTYDDHLKTIQCAGTAPATGGGIIIFDDVITQGNVSAACRNILIEKGKCKRVIGIFLGRTE